MHLNWWTFLFQTLNFVVLAYVLHRLLYRPLRAAIEQRRQANAQTQASAETARKAAEALAQQLQVQIADQEQHRQEVLHEAQEQAAVERQKLLGEAEITLQRRREEARTALAHEREEALKALRGEVIGQAVNLTQRLLRESTDRTLHQQLALHLVDALHDLPEAEQTQLRTQWRPEDGALLETAAELDGQTLQELERAVAALLGKPVALTVQSRPGLLAGVRLRLGGHVWDGSLAGQLPEGASP